jgi:DNA-binding MarR family transcriptional regulator
MKQKHARSNSFVYLLERTLRQSRSLLQREFNSTDAGISVDQWLVLQQIAAAPGQSLSRVAQMTAKDPATVTRIVALMARKKLVTKLPAKNDKRVMHVSITALGKKALNGCTKGVEQFRKTAAKGLSQEELNLQKKVLDKLFENCGGEV